MRRIALVMLLAGLTLGVAPAPATCSGPFGKTVCHDRDPSTDHDGREPESCQALR